ncbi:amidohydrolase family protein [Actinoplanes sp. NPDC051470]|uniref:amidohydrolase family protein n=1 Tax=Actinoplanes sp. NPDC051470 TaxID=3157224 RepID=UPI00342C1DEB
MGLGIDGPASNDRLDLLDEARTAALLARVTGRDPAAMAAADALLLATRGGAEALGRGDIGALEAGRWADVVQALRYYRTDRGHNEHSTNRRLTRGDTLLIGFDAFHLVDQLMTQPLQLVLAENLDGTGFDSSAERLWDLAPNRIDRTVIKEARHYEMYDVPEYVDAAVERLAGFYNDHL